MKIQVSKLRDVLSLLEPVVPKKPARPILANVKLSNGQVIAGDAELYVAVALDDIDGECLLPFVELSKLLKTVPGAEELEIKQDGGKIELVWSTGKATFELKPLEDFPGQPKEPQAIKVTVQGDRLVKTLKDMLPYCSKEDSKPILTGVNVNMLGDRIEVAGADGFRLGLKELPIAIAPTDTIKHIIISAKAVDVLHHLWSKAPRLKEKAESFIDSIMPDPKLSLQFDGNWLQAEFDGVVFIAKLIQGSYPSVLQLVPTGNDNVVQVYAPDLEQALKRVMQPARKGSGIVRFQWETVNNESRLYLKAGEEEVSTVEASLPCQIEKPGKIALHMKYVYDYVKGKASLLRIETKDEKSPAVFKYGQSPTVVVAPMNENLEGFEKATAFEPVGHPEETAKGLLKPSQKTTRYTSKPSVTPDSSVEGADVEKTREQIDLPLLLGMSGSEKVFWNPGAEKNPHALIVGPTGVGKTQTVKALIYELLHLRMPSIVLDFAADYENLGLNIFDLKKGIAINPLEVWPPKAENDEGRSPQFAECEIVDILKVIYQGLGVQQQTCLRKAINKAYKAKGIQQDSPESWSSIAPTLADVKVELEKMKNKTETKTYATTALGHLYDIFERGFFDMSNQIPFSEIIQNGAVLRLTSLPGDNLKTAVCEFFLQLMWYQVSKAPSKLRLFCVIDEAHRLAYEGSPVATLLREGRKFGVGIILASQRPSDFHKTVLANAACVVSLVCSLPEDAKFMANLIMCKSNEIQTLPDDFSAMVKFLSQSSPIRFKMLPYFDRIDRSG